MNGSTLWWGNTVFKTNSFTLLENALHYFENGEWKESEDLIESFPEGAIARRGPHKAVFSPELNTDAVFDIQTSDGKRIRGGVRQLQLTDVASGKSVVLGTVKKSVQARLLPPNRLLYRDAFDGIEADVLLEWRHNQYIHDVIIREQPDLPGEFDPQTAHLEVVTEMVDAPEPEIREQKISAGGKAEIIDHSFLGFGSMFMPKGKAFALGDEKAINLTTWDRGEGGIPVNKQWQQLPDGRRFLIEAVPWSGVEPDLRNLPAQQRAAAAKPNRREVASARTWPAKAVATMQKEPVQLAGTPYSPRGILVDFNLIGSASSYTFSSGVTYYIATSFSVGPSLATFEPGCVFKYANNAYLLLYGLIGSPSTQQTPVFTSVNDQGFGDIVGTGTDPSTARALKAIWVYFETSATTISNMRIRWAQRGVYYDQNSGVTASHTIQNSLFENITGTGTSGVYVNIPSGSGVTLLTDQKCNVTTPVLIATGLVTGSMTDAPFCTDKQFYALNMNDPTVISGMNNPGDPTGSVGASHFVEIENHTVAVYDKSTGVRSDMTSASAFFGVSPTTTGDPRMAYDWQCGRWIACMVDQVTAHVRVAISVNSNPVPLLSTNVWKIFDIPNESGWVSDYPTLGMDGNGYYITINLYQPNPDNPTSWKRKIVAIQKPSSCAMITATEMNNANNGRILLSSPYKRYVLQPAINYDSVQPTSPAWFVAKGDPSSGQGAISFARLTWSGSSYGVDATPWLQTLAPLDSYFDADGVSTFKAPQKPLDASHALTIDLGTHGSKLMQAVIRGGYLWTCNYVGVNKNNGTYAASGADFSLRSAVQWIKIAIPAQFNAVATTGRVFDTAASNPYWYYYPSVAANVSGDIALGFSGSKAIEYVGAFYWGRRASGTTTTSPILVNGGNGYMHYGSWGHYTGAASDNDGTLWLLQEHAETQVNVDSANYGTRITKVRTN